ncbi:MAG TPA: acyl-[ACP]--phospholipid O-acyltransferase [Gammaproteobacteria bacterium]|nr:acyl-[ACP]--phospholipid O-acyltransferase [Gammaproteobacteria bacterium]
MLVGRLFRVRVIGADNIKSARGRTLIVANHVSHFDALILYLFLPQPLVFALAPSTVSYFWVRPFLPFIDWIVMDPLNPYALKGMAKAIKRGDKMVAFPEGRITGTGSLMKIYEGSAMLADNTDANVLPIGIEGLQYSRFSMLKHLIRIQSFPRVKITCLAPRKLLLSRNLQGHERRTKATTALLHIMREVAYECAYEPVTLFQAIIDAMQRHGPNRLIIEDSTKAKLSYRQLLLRADIVGQFIAADTKPKDCVGIMLPSTAASIVVLTAAQSRGRRAAMLNFTAGKRGLRIAVETAKVAVVYTSRKFVSEVGLEDIVRELKGLTKVVYLEDLRECISFMNKLRGLIAAYLPNSTYRLHHRTRDPQDDSVILFTSGSEGSPKGVVLTHSNLIANRAQVQTLLALTHDDVVLNVLPMFHAFGLLGGVLAPLLDGAKIYCYPSPLHYRFIPELSYQLGATCLFGTNTFLAGYAKHCHPYDFHKMRFVIAGAEKLTADTRRLWADKCGIRVYEGYGATEASPVIAVNTPMGNKPNSVGQLLAKMEYYLEPVEGIPTGGRLIVRGPNIMRGYLLHDGGGDYFPPSTRCGQGWYDTGDIVIIDDDEFVTIIGRQKRFAKIGGEMVPLAQSEDIANLAWPEHTHAAVTLPDIRKGEQIILFSEFNRCDHRDLVTAAKELGIPKLCIPKQVIYRATIPLLGSGKVDYPRLSELARKLRIT